MLSYERIYKDLCSRYPGDDVHAFFNQHERKVRDRIEAEGRVQDVSLVFSSKENRHDSLIFKLKLDRKWSPAEGDEFVFESCTLRVHQVKRYYFEGVSEPKVQLVLGASAAPEGMNGLTTYMAWHEVLSEIEHISDIRHE